MSRMKPAMLVKVIIKILLIEKENSVLISVSLLGTMIAFSLVHSWSINFHYSAEMNGLLKTLVAKIIILNGLELVMLTQPKEISDVW